MYYILYRFEKEIEFFRRSSLPISEMLAAVARLVKPGIKTKEPDCIAETYIQHNGGIPAILNFHGYPAL